MKVLKGLVLTMLVSTATIFSMTDTVDGIRIEDLTLNVSGNNTNNTIGGSVVLGETDVDSSAVRPLTSVEAVTVILSRMSNNGAIDENTSSAFSTVLSLLGTDTAGAVTTLEGLTIGGHTFTTEIGSTIESVLSVLGTTGMHTWKVTTTDGIVAITSVDVSDVDTGSAAATSATTGESTLLTLTASEAAAINVYRGITSTAGALSSITLSSLLKANIATTTAEDTVDGLYSTLDGLDAITHGTTTGGVGHDLSTSIIVTGTHGDVVNDLSSSVMTLDLGTGGHVDTISGNSDVVSTTTVGGQIVDDVSDEEGDLS